MTISKGWWRSRESSPEDNFVKTLETEAKRRNVSSQEIISRLREELVKKGVQEAQETGSERFRDDRDSDCLSADDLSRKAQGEPIPKERESHLKSCSLCQKLLERAMVTPAAVTAMAQRLAAPADSHAMAHEQRRRERADQRKAQEALIRDAAEPSRPSARPAPAPSRVRETAMAILRLALGPVMVGVAILCYPPILSTPIAIWKYEAQFASLDRRANLQNTLEEIRSLDLLTVTAQGVIEKVPTEDLIPNFSLRHDGQNLYSYALKLSKGNQSGIFRLIDEHGQFDAEMRNLLTEPNSMVNVKGELQISKDCSPSIILQAIEPFQDNGHNGAISYPNLSRPSREFVSSLRGAANHPIAHDVSADVKIETPTASPKTTASATAEPPFSVSKEAERTASGKTPAELRSSAVEQTAKFRGRMDTPAGANTPTGADGTAFDTSDNRSRTTYFRGPENRADTAAKANVANKAAEGDDEGHKIVGRIKSLDPTKQSLVIILRDGKERSLQLSTDVKVTVNHVKSEEGLRDSAIKPGVFVAVTTEADGRKVKEIELNRVFDPEKLKAVQ